MKKRLFILLLVTVLITPLSMTACNKNDSNNENSSETTSEVTSEEPTTPETLSDYAEADPAIQKLIDDVISGESGSEVSINNGNVVVYKYELTKMDNYKEKAGDDPDVIAELNSSLENDAPKYGQLAKTLEEKTGITGKIKITVMYLYNGEMVATRSFDSSKALEETPEDEENKEKLIGTWYVSEVYSHQGDNITDQMTDLSKMFMTFNEDGTGSYLFSDFKYADRTKEKGEFTWRIGRSGDDEEAVGTWTVGSDSANIYLHEGQLFIDTGEMDSISTLTIRLFFYK